MRVNHKHMNWRILTEKDQYSYNLVTFFFNINLN